MANKQETLIYIEKDNYIEAEFMSRNFVNSEIKNRAYINALGAELVTKYLSSEGIKCSDLHNIHSVSKILENLDISDILLPNIHLDVRVVFDEKQIFIPKSHFEMEITPNAYVVLKLDKEFKHVELLGYFKPSQIDKRNENSEYYFIDKSKLSSPETLTKFVKEYIGKTSREISEKDLLRGRELSISLADHNLSVSEEKELLELLLLSNTLRESVLEFDNFETLSYSTAPVLSESLITSTNTEEDDNNENNDDVEEDKEILEENSDIETNEDITLDEELPTDELSLAAMSMDEELNLDETFPEEELTEPEISPAEIEENANEENDDDDNDETNEEVEDLETSDEEIIDEVPELDFVDLDTTQEETNIEEDLTTESSEDEIIEESLEESDIEIVDDIVDISEQEEEIITETENTEANSPEEILEKAFEDSTDENILAVDEDLNIGEIVEPDMPEMNLQDEEFVDVEKIEETEDLVDVEDVGETEEPQVEETANENAETSPQLEEQESQTLTEESLPISSDDIAIDNEPILELESTDLGDDLLGGNLLDENNEIITPELEKVEEDKTIQEEDVEIEEPLTTPEEKYTPQAMENLSVDSILDETIASISSTETFTEQEQESEKEDKIDSLEVAASATATALAGAVAKAEEEAQATVSEDAMKLASLSGDMIHDMVQNLEEEQQKNLNKIDYAKTDITTEIDVPDHMIAVTDDLSIAKMEGSLEAELSGEFGGPTDLDNLNKIEEYKEENFIQESVDFGSMETISQEELLTQGNENLDLGNLSDINIDMSAGANMLPDLNMSDKEEGVVDLPQFNTGGFTINEDGTSPMDDFVDMNSNIEQENTENLMEMNLDDDSNLAGNDLDFSSCIKPSTQKREDNFSSSNKPKSTIDAATKEILMANKITSNSDDDDFSTEDFGETIVIDDNEPFVIDEEDSLTNQQNYNNDTNIQDEHSDEISLEDFMGEDDNSNLELEEASNSTSDEKTLDNIEVPEENVSEQPENEETSQDWMNDTDYNNLEDIEIQNEEIPEDFITEPAAEEKTYAVAENSTVISDKTFKTGEIPIDINAQSELPTDGNESLANLYNPNSKIPGGAMLQTPGRMSNTQNQGRAAAGILGLVGTLIVLALVGAIGFGVAKFFKNPTEEAPQPITDEPIPTSLDNGVSETNTLKINPDNVVNMDNNTNALATTTKKSTQVNKQAPSSVNSTTSQKKGTAKPFVSISKLTWSLPSYVSYSPQFKQYFQSAGKSLKLSLTSDLLLATDYLYSNNMRVGITFAKDGTLQNAQIITSSGSNQIDKIVLQTVNQVLSTLKAPNSVGNEENTPVTLNLYF